VKLKISIATRLVFWITSLLCVLFGAVLFVIQRMEARTLLEETRARARLQAEHMAEINWPRLSLSDQSAVQKYVDEHVNEGLPYIVFYDKAGQPIAANEFIRDYEEILKVSRFDSQNTMQGDAEFQEKRIRLGDRSLRVLEVEIPIFPPDSETLWASVKLGHSLEPMYAQVRWSSTVLLLIGLAGLLLGVLGTAVLARMITRPIHRLVDGTVRIAKGDFSRVIPMSSKDEIGELGRSFNEMTSQLLQARQRMEAANRKLVQAEKLASIGRLAATIAHEIRNPLTSVKLNVQKLAGDESLGPAVQEHLGLSLEGIDQIERFIKGLLQYTRVADLALDRFPVEQIVDEALKMLQAALAHKGIRVERNYARDLPPVLVDGDKMRQVFLNVLRNAQEALGDGGRVSISVDAVEDEGRKKVRVRISDDGPGVSEGDRETIFEPFFTTRPAGFGLGLANARKIVEQHNGSIRVDPDGGPGACFDIQIPAEEGT
jgi:signal transduction histidine kinase/cell division protein FtsL